MRPSLALALSLVAAGPADCGRSPAQPPTAADPRTVVTSATLAPVHLLTQQASAYRDEAELVVRDAGTWRETWRALHGGVAAAPAPSIDFSREMVIVVALGLRNTGGFSVKVDAVVAEGTGAVVRYTATSPGPECITSQSTTAPLDVVRVPRAVGEIRFVPTGVRTAC